MKHYSQIVIEVLLPPSMRTGTGVVGAIASQNPVSEWMDLGEAYDLPQGMIRYIPVTGYGLIYGLRHKTTNEVWDTDAEIAEMNHDIIGYLDRRRLAKEERRQATIAAVRAFLKDFPLDTYAGIHLADRLARAGA